MKKLILDTTVCLDLFHGDLLRTVLKLPYEIGIPDVIAAELISPPGSLLIGMGYSIYTIPESVIEEISLLRKKSAKPSTNDLFALLSAKLQAGILVTGDDALRTIASEEGILVHGILWLLDEFVHYKILGQSEAAEAMERMIEAGAWLPRRECQLRLKKWRRGE